MKKGFTLLELMIVIVILGILAATIVGNFVNSLVKGRDAQRKSDLVNISRALELYYEDNRGYPATVSFGNSLSNPGGTRTYMTHVPNDPSSGYTYRYCIDASSSKYQLYAKLENTSDKAIITPSPLSNSGGSCTADCSGGCNYGTSSPNTTP